MVTCLEGRNAERAPPYAAQKALLKQEKKKKTTREMKSPIKYKNIA